MSRTPHHRDMAATTKNPTLSIAVSETVGYTFTVEVTDKLLDEAAAEGLPRTPEGVADLLMGAPDHGAITDGIDPKAPAGIYDRFVSASVNS